MRKLFKERKLLKGGNYMRKYGTFFFPMKIWKKVSHFSKKEEISLPMQPKQ
jgi:hypothetical protein